MSETQSHTGIDTSTGDARPKRTLNELVRKDAEHGEPSRVIPDHLGEHYHRDGNSMRSARIPDKIEFIDRGNRMHAYFPVSSFTVRSMAEVAEARGWKEIEVTGTEKFRQSVYVEATMRGIQVSGYQATDKDKEILDRRADVRAARDNPIVQAFLAAESKKDRDDAVKKYPQLKDAFAADAAIKAKAATLDSKKAELSVIARGRDNLSIDLHQGRALSVEVRDLAASKDASRQLEHSR
jgi:Large polyvalent protein-associated domain 7